MPLQERLRRLSHLGRTLENNAEPLCIRNMISAELFDGAL